MSQQQSQAEYTPTYMTPLPCKCGGLATLVRRTPEPRPAGEAYRERRTFECAKCEQTFDIVIED